MTKRILLLALALLMVISLVGCAEISLRHNTETSAPTQETSSDEQSATETWDCISDGETEATTQTEATQPTQSQETTEKEQKEPETTKPSDTQPTEEAPKQPQEEQQPKPTEPKQEEKPAESTPPHQTEPPKETEPPKQTESESETEPPATEEPAQPPVEKVQIDTAAIESYAKTYAQSLGFTIDTSLGKGNGGYYSPDYRPLTSMDEGYSSAVGMTNATKNQLNSRFSTEPCDTLVESIYGLVRYNCKVVYSHTDELGDWYYVYVFYG